MASSRGDSSGHPRPTEQSFGLTAPSGSGTIRWPKEALRAASDRAIDTVTGPASASTPTPPPSDLGERQIAAVAANVLDRSFEAPAPNHKSIADFTYIQTAEGWLHVANERLFKCHRDFPYAGLWLCVAAKHFAADGSLVAIIAEQQPFYRRSFNYRIVCEARPYPQTAKRLCLMPLHFPSVTNHLYHQYAFFYSSPAERQKIFARQRLQLDLEPTGHKDRATLFVLMCNKGRGNRSQTRYSESWRDFGPSRLNLTGAVRICPVTNESQAGSCFGPLAR